MVYRKRAEAPARGKGIGMKITKDCMACGMCIEECPNEAISIGERGAAPGPGLDVAYSQAVIDRDRCVNCGACVDTCPANAIVED